MNGKILIGPDGKSFLAIERRTTTVEELMGKQAQAEAKRKQILAQRAKKCRLHNEKVKTQAAQATDMQATVNSSEVINVQNLGAFHRLMELLKPPATSDIFEKSLELDEFAKIITDKSVISAFDELFAFAQESVKEEERIKGSARLFLAAMLIDKHPVVLNTQKFDIKEKSYSLAMSFKKWEISAKNRHHQLKAQFEQQLFLKELRGYAKIYCEWQKEDMRVLEDNIQAEYEASTKLLEKVANEEEWEPHVSDFRAKVGNALSSLEKSAQDAKSTATQSVASLTVKEDVPVEELLKSTEDKPDIFLKPDNAQIAHDLYMEGANFDYFKLYGPQTPISTLNLASDSSSLLEFILKIGSQLAEMVPKGKPTHTLLMEAFDRKLLESQVLAQAFDPIPLLNFTIDICSKLCSESRDSQVEALKGKMIKKDSIDLSLVCTDLTMLMQDMQKDLMNYNLAMLLPRLPTIIVQYERDAFIHNFNSDIPILYEAANSVKSSLMPGQSLTAQFLAAKIFITFVLEEGLLVETFFWDHARLVDIRKSVLDLAKKSATALVEKNESLKSRINSAANWRDEPTIRIIYNRILDCLRKDISSANDLSSSPAKQGIMPVKDYDVIRVKCRRLFEHNFKVFEPLYQHLSQI